MTGPAGRIIYGPKIYSKEKKGKGKRRVEDAVGKAVCLTANM